METQLPLIGSKHIIVPFNTVINMFPFFLYNMYQIISWTQNSNFHCLKLCRNILVSCLQIEIIFFHFLLFITFLHFLRNLLSRSHIILMQEPTAQMIWLSNWAYLLWHLSLVTSDSNGEIIDDGEGYISKWSFYLLILS